MKYYVDGYNLLFFLDKDFSERDALIEELAELPELCVVFDAAKTREILRRHHLKGLELVYTAENQSADDYLVEVVTHAKHSRTITVVTNDKPLSQAVREAGGYTMPLKTFLKKSSAKKQEPDSGGPLFTQDDFDRWLDTFEKNL